MFRDSGCVDHEHMIVVSLSTKSYLILSELKIKTINALTFLQRVTHE